MSYINTNKEALIHLSGILEDLISIHPHLHKIQFLAKTKAIKLDPVVIEHVDATIIYLNKIANIEIEAEVQERLDAAGVDEERTAIWDKRTTERRSDDSR